MLEADASQAPPVDGPFDVIVLSGSVAEVPRALLGQLKPGGRLTAIVGQLPIMRAVLLTRPAAAQPQAGRGQRFSTVELFDTVAPRLLGFGEPSRFTSERRMPVAATFPRSHAAAAAPRRSSHFHDGSALDVGL